MVNRGIRKPLWIIAIALVILLIVVILLLFTSIIPGGVTVTTGGVTDHHYKTSVKVTLEGERDSYTLSMTGSKGLEVSSVSIAETQMADGKQSVWMPLVLKYGVAAKPGAYSLVVTDFSGSKVYEKTLGPYSGPDLSIINIKTPLTYYDEDRGEYYIELVPLTCRNDGDLPAYITRVDIKIDTKEGSYSIPIFPSYRNRVVLPGEAKAIRAKFSYAGLSSSWLVGPFDGGDYSATFKLLNEVYFEEEKTVATCTKIISIP